MEYSMNNMNKRPNDSNLAMTDERRMHKEPEKLIDQSQKMLDYLSQEVRALICSRSLVKDEEERENICSINLQKHQYQRKKNVNSSSKGFGNNHVSQQKQLDTKQYDTVDEMEYSMNNMNKRPNDSNLAMTDERGMHKEPEKLIDQSQQMLDYLSQEVRAL